MGDIVASKDEEINKESVDTIRQVLTMTQLIEQDIEEAEKKKEKEKEDQE